MIETKTCINVWSDMNTWIDFCVIVLPKDFFMAEKIIRKAYDDWWELEDAAFLPIAEYIGLCLKENEIEHEMYFKNKEEE